MEPIPSTTDSKAGGLTDDLLPGLMGSPISTLIQRQALTVPPGTSILEAAQHMTAQRVSSLLVVQDGQLLGVMTDRDLRSRAVATGLDSSRAVIEIATPSPISIEWHCTAFEALLLMTQRGIHHLPVLKAGQLMGMVTATDLLTHFQTSPLHLATAVPQQTSLEGLKTLGAGMQRLQQTLVAADATAASTGHIIAAMSDAITQRLLELAHERLGPPPLSYAWIAVGSQGRREQTAGSDQDNALVLDDAYNPAEHGAYFEALAQAVCDGLHACGQTYCPGNMMASTGTWRQPRHRWAEHFTQWIVSPEPEALMHTCVFFDLRVVHGDASLVGSLQQEVLRQTRDNGLFLAHLADNALSRTPPLGWFGSLNPERHGEHKGTVDIKHHGVVPVVDLARVYALAAGRAEVNTHERLLQAAGHGELSEAGARDLRDAHEFLAVTRLRHQSRQLAVGQAPDNHLRLDELSNFERTQLRDAFSVVHQHQQLLAQRFRL